METRNLSLLPGELLHLIFHFLRAKDLLNVSYVCKQLWNLIDNDNLIWKLMVERWWKKNGAGNLEIIEKEIRNFNSKSWQWLGKASAQRTLIGLSWGLTCEVLDSDSLIYSTNHQNTLRIGFFKEGKLHSFAVLVRYIIGDDKADILIGNFNEDMITKGVHYSKSGTRFEGVFSDNNYEKGTLYHLENEWKYEGTFSRSLPHGNGVLEWVNGFKYNGEFNEGQPKDKDKCIHPSLKEAIGREACTRTVTGGTGHYGQFLSIVTNYCVVCIKYCVGVPNPLIMAAWKNGGFCHCGTYDGEDQCKAPFPHSTSPSSKKRKLEDQCEST